MSTQMPFNPWLHIWFNPRTTIRRIVAINPERNLALLVGLSGFAGTLDTASQNSWGDGLPLLAIPFLAAISGFIGGFISLYISGGVLYLTGRWLGGRANGSEIRAALAWSSAPKIVGLVLWLPLLALFGRENFTTVTPRMDFLLTNYPILWVIVIGLIVFAIVLLVWQFVLYLLCLSEVQRFSVWRALGATLIPFLILLVPVGVCVLLAGL